jgi:predicted dehydrogenase
MKTGAQIESPVRVGVVGVGFMGRQHVEFIREKPGAHLVAVADPTADPSEFDCETYPSLNEMLGAQQLNAVIISNPNALHVDAAIQALRHGVAVLVEKPVATSYAEALRLVQVVDELNGRLLVAQHRRHHPAVAAARRVIADGEIGQLVAVSGMWSARKDDAYFTDVPWHRERGAGVTLMNFVHDLDLLRFVCGEVVEIQAMASSHTRGHEVEDTISVNLRFASGAVGSFLASDCGVSPWGWDQSTEDSAAFPYLPDGTAYQFVGTRGALSVPNLARYGYHPGVSPDWRSPLSRTYVSAGIGNAYAAQLDHFIDVARGRSKPLVTAVDAARTLALVEAAAFAAVRQETVDVARFSAATAEQRSDHRGGDR